MAQVRRKRPLPIFWSTRARNDLKEISDYIKKDSYDRALEFSEHLKHSVTRLAHFPYSGRVLPERPHLPYRELIVGNYRIMYSCDDDREVNIITVRHCRRLLK